MSTLLPTSERFRSRSSILICACLASAGAVGWTSAASGDDSNASRFAVESSTVRSEPKSTDQSIRELIEKLGSDSYATRVRAREQLQAYGLEAFDALRDAQNHDDSEILAAARYLIKSLHVSWSKDSDPKEVREILSEYGAQDEAERLGRIEMLGRLQDQMGVEALARLARFERSEPLSRRAAILVLGQTLPREKAHRARLADQMEQVIGENQRDASVWLQAYAKDLRDGRYSAKRWGDMVRGQRARVDSGATVDITSKSVMQLIRVLASRALEEGASEEALALVMDNNDLVAPTTRDLAEHAAWAIRQELYPVVVTLYEQHRHAFGENAELLYSAAQAFDELGQGEKGEQLATEALYIKPLPKMLAASKDASDNEDAKDSDAQGDNGLTDHQLEELAGSHRRVALLLQRRGRFDWAERESLAVIEHCDIESAIGASTRQTLAMTYAEQQRHQDAVDLLEPMIERAKKDRLYQPRLVRFRISVSFLRSLYEYEGGLALLKQHAPNPDGKILSQVKEKFQLAYRFDTDNIDILIRMYRLDDPSDPDWKPTVLKLIVQNRDKLARDIAVIEARKSSIPKEQYEEGLGELYNQFAWLVANTEGDYERALKLSQQSLEYLDADQLSARAARLDTCARCYFALDRVAEAIETQRLAIELEPHSPAMLRQLAEFKAAL